MGMTGDGKKGSRGLLGSGCKRDSMLVIAVGGGLPLLPFLLMLGFWTHRLVEKRKLAKIRQRYLLQNGGMLLKQQMFSQIAPLRIFTSDELEKATNNFMMITLLVEVDSGRSTEHIIRSNGCGNQEVTTS